MAQQINLCTPMFLTPKRHLPAHSLVKGLVAFVLLGGVLGVYWHWSVQQIDAAYRSSIASNRQELSRLQAAIKTTAALNAPADAAMMQELQRQRDELQQRENLLAELRRGLNREGQGHSARLLLVAQSIPSQVWVTEVKADELRMELSGYTLEPAALNVWMARLAKSPLLQGQHLAAVKVERAASELRSDNPAPLVTPVGLKTAKPAAPPPIWSFNIVSALASTGSVETPRSKP